MIIGILGYEFNIQNPKPGLHPGASWRIAFVSILLHELGHAVAFRRFGVDPNITLVRHGRADHRLGSADARASTSS